MTLRALVSFDHALLTGGYLITPQTTYSSNVLQTIFGLPGGIMTGVGGNANQAAVGANGWLNFGVSNSSYYSGYVISLADLGLFQGGATQAWIGFRTYANAVVPSSCNVVGLITSLTNLQSAGSGISTMLTETQLNRLGTGTAYAQYVECFIDSVALTFQTYVNGVLTSSGAIPSGAQYIVFSGQAFSGSANQFYRDFYFLDVDSTKPNGRLGPITSSALAPSVANSQLPNYSNYIASLNGSAAVTTAQSRFGNASLSPGSAGTSSWVSMPDSPSLRVGATGDVTYECWVYNTLLTQTGYLFAKGPGTNAYLYYNSNSWYLYTDSGAAVLTAAAGQALNTWYHIALVRYNGVWTLYQNGVALGTYGTAATFGNNSGLFYIGNAAAGTSPFQGYIDEFRISNVARYTAAFTPPAAQFSPDANTVLLMHFNSQLNGYVADHSGAQPSAFQTAQGAAFAMVPFVQNGADNQAMSLNFQSTAQAGQKIVAMQYKMAAQVPFAMNLLASMTETGQPTKTLPTYQFRDVLANYGRDLAGIQTLAPDGTAWTPANMAITNLVLQPQSTTAGSTN